VQPRRFFVPPSSLNLESENRPLQSNANGIRSLHCKPQVFIIRNRFGMQKCWEEFGQFERVDEPMCVEAPLPPAPSVTPAGDCFCHCPCDSEEEVLPFDPILHRMLVRERLDAPHKARSSQHPYKTPNGSLSMFDSHGRLVRSHGSRGCDDHQLPPATLVDTLIAEITLAEERRRWIARVSAY
jgi:hypothetical protein